MSLIIPMCLALAGPVAAEPTAVAGMPFTAATTSGANDLEGLIQVPFGGSTEVHVTYHLGPKSDRLSSAFLTTPFSIPCNGYTFTIEHAHYDAPSDTFVGHAAVTGEESAHLPKRLLAQDVRFNSTGILSVGHLTSKGWATAHGPWSIAHGKLTPSGLAWNNKSREIEVKGLFLQRKFHAEIEAEVRSGQVAGIRLLKPTTVLHHHRVAFLKAARLEGGEIRVDGYAGAPDGKRWDFKNVRVKPDGSLELDYPFTWAQPPAPVHLQPVLHPLPSAMPRRAPSASLPQLASTLNSLPPSSPSTLSRLGPPWGAAGGTLGGTDKMPPELFAHSTALARAVAQNQSVVPVAGAPNLQMVITQQGSDKVDGFIPLMDWVGQAQVYGAVLKDGQAHVDKATMKWLKTEVRPPATGFCMMKLHDPVRLNPTTGRLTSGLSGRPTFRGLLADLVAWEVDTKEFRLECGSFTAVGAKLNPLGAAAPWSMSMSTTGAGVSVQSKPSVPSNAPMANPNGPIGINYQGGTEFDIVFLDGGDWGFEIRTALPQLDIGGPEWMRSGTALAPKGVKWPSIFAKIYNNGFVYFNFAGQGISIPLDCGLAISSPGLLFEYVPNQALFYLLADAQITIQDVSPNIFACKGKLYVDGSGMGKSGGGEVEITGYILNVQTSEFDVGFAAIKKPDGTYEEQFAVTCPIIDILGFFKVEISGEANVHAPPNQYVVGVSGWVHLIFFDIGVTFYGYRDGRVHFSFGGHEFHVASGGSGDSQYTGTYNLMGLNWFGTETVDTTKGGVTASGKADWTSGGNFKATASLSDASLSEEGVNSASLTLTNVTVSIPYNGQTLTATAAQLPLVLNSSAGQFVGTIPGVPVTAGKFKGKANVDVVVTFTGIMNVSFDLPASAGGALTEQLPLTSVGQQ